MDFYRAPDIGEGYGCAGCSTVTGQGEIFARNPVVATCADCGAALCPLCGIPEPPEAARERQARNGSPDPAGRKFMICRAPAHYGEGPSLYA